MKPIIQALGAAKDLLLDIATIPVRGARTLYKAEGGGFDGAFVVGVLSSFSNAIPITMMAKEILYPGSIPGGASTPLIVLTAVNYGIGAIGLTDRKIGEPILPRTYARKHDKGLPPVSPSSGSNLQQSKFNLVGKFSGSKYATPRKPLDQQRLGFGRTVGLRQTTLEA